MGPEPVAASGGDAALVAEWFRRYAAREPMEGLVDPGLTAHGSPTFLYPIEAQDPDGRAAELHEHGVETELREIVGTDPHGRVAFAGAWYQRDGSAGMFYGVAHITDGRIVAVTYVDRREDALAEMHR